MRNALSWLVLAAALAACATGPTLTPQERLALYREHAGAPVLSFRLDHIGGMHNWTALGDQTLAIWTSSNRGHLLELRTRCPGMMMSPRLSITNTMGQVTARMDRVVPRTAAGPTGSSCRIESIRPIDGRALRDAKRELREANYIELSAAPPEAPDTPSD